MPQVMAAKKRYEVGLEKLAFTAEQVVVMQAELTALKPNLITTVAETERLMATVQKEKTEVRLYLRAKACTHQDLAICPATHL
jgi:dynein heavy chain, axonemal